jgi:hypothetical protein
MIEVLAGDTDERGAEVGFAAEGFANGVMTKAF